MNKDSLDVVLGTVVALLDAEGMSEVAAFVRTYPARAEQTGFDNWNGGTEIWTIFFDLPPHDYARLGSRREQLQEQINARLKTVLEHETSDWYSTSIVPSRAVSKEWRTEGGRSQLASATRELN